MLRLNLIEHFDWISGERERRNHHLPSTNNNNASETMNMGARALLITTFKKPQLKMIMVVFLFNDCMPWFFREKNWRTTCPFIIYYIKHIDCAGLYIFLLKTLSKSFPVFHINMRHGIFIQIRCFLIYIDTFIIQIYYLYAV